MIDDEPYAHSHKAQTLTSSRIGRGDPLEHVHVDRDIDSKQKTYFPERAGNDNTDSIM